MAEIIRVQVSCPSPGQFEVRIVESPGGEPHNILAPPFDRATTRAVTKVLEGWELDRLVEEECAGLRALGVLTGAGLLGPDERNHLLGRRLYQALFPSSEDPNRHVRGALQSALDQAIAKGEPVSLQVRFDHDAVELAALPWELICDSNSLHLAATDWMHLTRYISFGKPVATLPVSDRLEVLTVTPRPKRGASDLGPDRERRAILRAFEELSVSHRLHAEPCEPPTYERLCHLITQRPYHIIHFDGHGGFLARCPDCRQMQLSVWPVCNTPGCPSQGQPLERDTGCLAFEDGAPVPAVDLVTATELATLLAGRGVLLFVASACQSAMVGGASVFSSVGPSMILAGLPASVAMQYPVDIGPALRFTEKFYGSIAQGRSIAAAASAGRAALLRGGDWFVPSVYLRSRDGEGFLFRYHSWLYVRPPEMSRPELESMRARDAAPYKFLSPYEITDKAVFFGREDDTDRLLEEVLHRPLVVLSGLPGVGKTSLVNAGLAPELLARDYMVLTLREYGAGDPVEGLRETVNSSSALDLRSPRGQRLSALLESVMVATGRPVVVVFDELENYLVDASAGQRAAFAEQIAECIEAHDPTGCCLLLVVRADFVGRMPVLLPGIPGILHGLVPLEALTRDQARHAIEDPLSRHDPPMRFDKAFLEHTLLEQLADAENRVSPSYLQIVCRELYDAARQARAGEDAYTRVMTIGPELYPARGVETILARYLDDSLGRLGPPQRHLARALLKAMAPPGAEQVFVPVDRLAEAANAPTGDVQVVLNALLKDGLLEPRPLPDGSIAYSAGHPMLAAEVRSWFDPEEALDRCAQDSLDRDWNAWYQEWYVGRREDLPGAGRESLLVSADHLRQIRARRPNVRIGAEQFCLVLQSAVQHRCDVAYWAHELAGSEPALGVLLQVHDGPAPGTPAKELEAVALAAEALGAGHAYTGQQGLARAAVALGGRTRRDGAVRHTAALAVAALVEEALPGQSAVNETFAAMRRAAPASWRITQVLAQMKAAGFELEGREEVRRKAVAAWAFGIALWAHAGSIVVQSAGGGFGAAIGLSLALLASTFLRLGEGGLTLLLYGFRGFFLQPLGLIVGFLAVAGALIAAMPLEAKGVRRRTLRRITGFILGFVAGLVLLWVPAEFYLAVIFAVGDVQGLTVVDALATYVLGGAMWAAGIAGGWELWVRLYGERRRGWVFMGGGLGGAGACLAIMLLSLALSEITALYSLSLRVPLIEESGYELANWIEAFLAGFGIGGGLTAGWEAGRRLWQRMQSGA